MTEQEKKEQEERERLEAEKRKQEQGDGGDKGDGGSGDSDKTYSEAYVKGLREENAKWRKKTRETEERLGKLDGIDPSNSHFGFLGKRAPPTRPEKGQISAPHFRQGNDGLWSCHHVFLI